MNETDLNRLLQSTRVPDRGDDYWKQFPTTVMAEIRRRQSAAPEAPDRPKLEGQTGGLAAILRGLPFPVLRPALAFGLVALCIAAGYILGVRHERLSPESSQLAQMRKCFQEIEGLFPNQLRAIVFDQQGVRLMLADQPDVPTSAPLYVRIEGPRGCQRFITFSGQQIRLDGDTFDVLVDRLGGVLIVGEQWVWSSSSPVAKASPYRIEARPLLSAL